MKWVALYRLIAAVAAIPYLLAVLLPFFAVYNLPANEDDWDEFSLYGKTILICTADGFRLVSTDDLPREKDHTPDSDYQCGLCVLAANGLSVFAHLTAGLVQTPTGKEWTAFFGGLENFIYISPPFSHAFSRAPPFRNE